MYKTMALVLTLVSGCATSHFVPDAAHGFIKQSVSGRDGRVYRPKDWTADKRWPVIVYLHGGGERGKDGLAQTQVGLGPVVQRSNGTFPFVVLFPQTDKPWAMPESESALLAFIDAAIAQNAGDPERVYLTGNSMGGFGTWILGARHPDRFAALAPICGGVRPPRGVKVPPESFARQPDPELAVAKALGPVPVWAFHGGKDWVASPKSSRRLVEAMQKVGGDVRYTEYPDLGHNSWDRAYADPALYDWLLSKRKPAKAE